MKNSFVLVADQERLSHVHMKMACKKLLYAQLKSMLIEISIILQMLNRPYDDDYYYIYYYRQCFSKDLRKLTYTTHA